VKKPLEIHFMSKNELIAKRNSALDKLGMDLEQARAQWDSSGSGLVNGNWHDLVDLEVVSDMDYLLCEGRYSEDS